MNSSQGIINLIKFFIQKKKIIIFNNFEIIVTKKYKK